MVNFKNLNFIYNRYFKKMKNSLKDELLIAFH